MNKIITRYIEKKFVHNILVLVYILLILKIVRNENVNTNQRNANFLNVASGFNSNPKLRAKTNCSSVKDFQCTTSLKCIKSYQVCDGFANCPDKSDEKNCDWCNRTFSNEQLSRLVIQNPYIINSTSQISCYYKIVNVKPNTIIGIRFRKFSVGKYNAKLKKCESSWIEIDDSDSENATSDSSGTDQEIIKSRFNRELSLSRIIDLKNLTKIQAMLKNTSKNGKFCGTWYNFWSSYYSPKSSITLKYFNPIPAPNYHYILNDTYEFEVSFYDTETLNPNVFSKHKYQKPSLHTDDELKHFNYGNIVDDVACTRIYMNCTNKNTDACLVSTAGYPGVYLKNKQCQYYIKNELQQTAHRANIKYQKLILLNDHLQIDSTLCHFEPSNIQSASTYICDTGLRSSNECNDHLTIYNGVKQPDEQSLLRNICGMGSLAKIVLSKSAILLEFSSSPEGLFANSGFLFYAMGQASYLEKFDLFNNFDKKLVRNDHEFNSLKYIEKLQIENCDSDMTSCTLVINESILDEIYPIKKRESSEEKEEEKGEEDFENIFKIGYLYNMNQYQPDGFKLKYILESTRFNTIAIYLDNYQPSSVRGNSSEACKENYLTMESLNHDPSLEVEEQSRKSLLVKLCTRADFERTPVKYFLIKTSSNFESGHKKHLLITYFSSNASLTQSSKLFDFKLSFEYINFDWHTYQKNSVCDFVYNLNSDEGIPLSGVITNPKSSIFYKTADEYLKCKYRLVSKPNQYIKLTVKSIQFDMNEKKEKCENVYFTNVSQAYAKCSRLSKKILIKELKYSWTSSPESDIFYDSFSGGDSGSQDFDESDSTSSQFDESLYQRKNLETKLCLCETVKDVDLYYVSKYDAIEIEYSIRIDKDSNDLGVVKRNDFYIKYEFLDRKCDKFSVTSLKSNLKGKFVYFHAGYGIQSDLFKFINESHKDITSLNLETISDSVSVENKAKKEQESLNAILIENLNFNCKFNIRAPKNHFIHIEFSELLIPKSCEHNSIKMYSSFSHWNTTSSLENFFSVRPVPFMRLCPTNEHLNRKNTLETSTESQNMVVAEFFEDSLANSSFSCLSSKNKICFLTNEIKNELNPFKFKTRSAKGFFNNLIIDIISDNLDKFYFEIKYHFYKIEFSGADSSARKLKSESSDVSDTSDRGLFSGLKNDKYDSCDFKCGVADSSSHTSQENDFHICLDESLVCDQEVHCIYSDFDEVNCPIKLKSKTILILLCSLFGFTLTVLFIFCIYKKYVSDLFISKSKTKKDKKAVNSKSIRYSEASQVDNLQMSK